MWTDYINTTTIFQSTHPVRGATCLPAHQYADARISIHAPREGCDSHEVTALLDDVAISIHAPREGCDRETRASAAKKANFNPRTP